MSAKNTLQEIINKDNLNRKIAENKLKNLCGLSSRIKYEDLINRLMEITKNKIPLESYKMADFIILLAEDLEYAQIVNRDCWDMTIKEIDIKYKDETWESEYEKHKNCEDLGFKSLEEYKNITMDWSYTYSLDGTFSGVQQEYLRIKEKGLID